MEITWETVAKSCVLTMFAFLLTILSVFIIRPTKIEEYYLGNNGNGHPAICVIKSNGCDETITLNPLTTHQEAINLVDSLNKTIKK
jgi:hypothetical protein